MSDKSELSSYRQAKAIDRMVASATGGKQKITSFKDWRSQAKGVVTGRRGRVNSRVATATKTLTKRFGVKSSVIKNAASNARRKAVRKGRRV